MYAEVSESEAKISRAFAPNRILRDNARKISSLGYSQSLVKNHLIQLILQMRKFLTSA